MTKTKLFFSICLNVLYHRPWDKTHKYVYQMQEWTLLFFSREGDAIFSRIIMLSQRYWALVSSINMTVVAHKQLISAHSGAKHIPGKHTYLPPYDPIHNEKNSGRSISSSFGQNRPNLKVWKNFAKELQNGPVQIHFSP